MYWLYAASLLSALTVVLHVVGGGQSTAKPLLDSGLADEAKYTNYYCWHMVTITIATMAVCFFLGARSSANINLALLASCLSLAFGIWSVVLVALKKQKPLTMPQWLLFLPIAAIGFIGSLIR